MFLWMENYQNNQFVIFLIFPTWKTFNANTVVFLYMELFWFYLDNMVQLFNSLRSNYSVVK